MDIRPAEAADLPWILEKSVETGWAQLTDRERARTNPGMLARAVQAMVAGTLGARGGLGLVAWEGVLRVGYLLVGTGPNPLTGETVGLFNDIYVDPASRRRGIATALCEVGEAYLRSLGLTEVRRVIAAHNTASLQHAIRGGSQVDRYLLSKPL